MTDQLFNQSKEYLSSMSAAQLERFKSKIENDLRLERKQGSHDEQKAYTPMPWMIPNMERGLKVVDELLGEKRCQT